MKKIFAATLAVLFLCGCGTDIPIQTDTQTETTAETQETLHEYSLSELWDYRIKDGYAEICRYLDPPRSDSELIIPETLEGYPVIFRDSKAFAGTDVTRLIFPESVPATAVTGASYLEVIDLPSNVSRLSGTSFMGCDSLREINIAEGGSYKSSDGVVYTADGKELIIFPRGRTGDFDVPDGVEKICESAFQGSCTDSVTLPGSVREIGRCAFMFSKITDITLNEGLVKIDSMAFVDTNIQKLFLPDSVSEIGYNIVGENDFIRLSVDSKLCDTPELYGFSVEYRNETMLQRAIRKGKRKFLNIDSRDNDVKLIFADLSGDGFPEMIYSFEEGFTVVYEYSDDNGWDGGYYLRNKQNTYYDRENDRYFYIDICASDEYMYCEYASMTYMNDDGEWLSESYGVNRLECNCGNDWDSGFTVYFGGRQEEVRKWDKEHPTTFEVFAEFIESTLSEYELVDSMDMVMAAKELLGKYTVTEGGSHVFIEEGLSDSLPIPAEDGRSFVKPNVPVLFKIGEVPYYEDTFEASLEGGECTPENFKKLSELKNLTRLYIYGEADLTGIEVLTNIRYLELGGYSNITNYESISKLTWLESIETCIMDDMSFMKELDKVKRVRLIPWNDKALDKSADFFTPLADMDSLEYLSVNTYDGWCMTEEQVKWINENLGDVMICSGKFS